MEVLLALEEEVVSIFLISRRIIFIIAFTLVPMYVWSQDSILIVRSQNILVDNFPKLLLDSSASETIRHHYNKKKINYVSIEPYNICGMLLPSTRSVMSIYPLCFFERDNNWVRVDINHTRHEDVKELKENSTSILETQGDLLSPNVFILDTSEVVSLSSKDTLLMLYDLQTLNEKSTEVSIITYSFSNKYVDILKSINFTNYPKIRIHDEDFYVVTFRRFYNYPQKKVFRYNHTILGSDNRMTLMIIKED